MLSEEDKKRIAAEEAYRAQIRTGGTKPPSQIGVGMKRQMGTVMFNVIGLFVILVVGLAACSMLGR